MGKTGIKARIELLAGERQPGESNKAVMACNDWLRLGPGRSFPGLLEKYAEIDQNKPPTRSIATLKSWSATYSWQSRATIFDTELEHLKNERRRQVLESDLALDFERVLELRKLAHFLIEQIYEASEPDESGRRPFRNLWLHDVKAIGSGPAAEKVDIERYNGTIIENVRGLLDDLARETGGRRQQTANLNIDLSQLTNEQLERISNGEDPLSVLFTTESGG